VGFVTAHQERRLKHQLLDLANEAAAHCRKQGVVSHHQPEHSAYLISQCVVDIRRCKGFAEDIQFLECLQPLGQKLGTIQAIKLLSSLVETLQRTIFGLNGNLLKGRIGLPDKMLPPGHRHKG
jgi:hypothetical protein